MQAVRVTKIPVGLAVLLLATSCGGGVSREDFAAEVDPVCAAVNSDFEDLGEPQSPEELVPFLEAALQIASDGLAALRTVEPPAEDQDTFDEWIDTLEEQNDKAEEGIAAAEAGDQATLEAVFAEIDELSTEGNELAADLGLEDCAEDSGE